MTARHARLLGLLVQLIPLFAVFATKYASQMLACPLIKEPSILHKLLLAMKLMLVEYVGYATKYARMNVD